MSNDVVGQEQIGLEVSRMNSWLDDGIHNAQSIVDTLREMRSGTESLLNIVMSAEEFSQVEQVSDDIKSACIAVEDARQRVHGVNM